MVIIRIKIKSKLVNITEKENYEFEVKGIRNNGKISYCYDNVKYMIKYNKEEVILVRESDEFINSFVFNKAKSKSNYLLKENGYDMDMDIEVKKIEILDNYIYVKYEIMDTSCEYEFKIEMSEVI